jgi:hypothetical protein
VSLGLSPVPGRRIVAPMQNEIRTAAESTAAAFEADVDAFIEHLRRLTARLDRKARAADAWRLAEPYAETGDERSDEGEQLEGEQPPAG